MSLRTAGFVSLSTLACALAACSGSDEAVDDESSAVGTVSFHGASHATSGGAAASSLSVPKPASLAAGDVEIAAVTVSDAAVAVTPPAGWSLVRDTSVGAAPSMQLALFVHAAGTSEPASYAFGLSTARSVSAGIVAYAGVSTKNPVDGVATSSSAAPDATPTAPAITACAPGEMILTVYASSLAAPSTSTWTPPTNQSERVDATTARTTSGASNVSLEMNDLGPKTTAGTFGPYTATSSVAGIDAAAALSLFPSGASCGATTDAGADSGGGGGGGAIVTKGSASKSSGGSSLSFAGPPAGTSAGDYLVAQVVTRGASASPTPPASSWTKIAEADDGSGRVHEAVFGLRAASSTSGGGTWTAPAGATSFAVTMTAFSGVSSVHAHAQAGVGSPSIAFDAPALTGTSTGDEALVFLASDGGPRPWADRGTLFGVIPTGSVPAKWVDLQTLHAFESLVGRKMAYGHSWLPWDFRGGFPAASSGTGPLTDLADGRMSFFSWPSELTWPDGGAQGNGDPMATLNAIANGSYDAMLAGNAQVLKQWGQPAPFRLFCEMNGGDHPWEVGHQTSPALTSTNYPPAFIRAWRRIWVITKGTAADATALGFTIASGNLVHADNVLFHWNPQTYETTTQVDRDMLWPGDKYVDFAGTELYLRSSSGQSTYVAHMTDTSAGNNTHQPLYATYGPGGSRNQSRALLGNGEGGNAGLLSGVSSFVDPSSGMPAHPAWKFFTWWNGGTSTVQNESPTVQQAVRTFVQDPWMSPTLSTSFDAPAGWREVYQYRYETGRAAGANYGAEQAGTILVRTTAGGASVAGPHVVGYGLARAAIVSVALSP